MFLREFGIKGLLSLGGTLLLMRWGAVCRHGPCGPISSLHPWDDWIPPDLHCFFQWVFDSLEVLNGFLRQVVVSRRDDGIRRWNRWLKEDLSSRPYAWLRPDYVPPSPFLVLRILLLSLLRLLLNLILLMLSFVKPGCLISVGLVILKFLLKFLDFIGQFLPQENVLDLPRITGRDLQEVARAKKATAGGLDGWAWNELKALPLLWFSGLAILLELVESTGNWPQGLLGCLYCHDTKS